MIGGVRTRKHHHRPYISHHENFTQASSSSHFPPWEYCYWLEPSPSPSWEKSATHICQHGIEVWEQLCLVKATSSPTLTLKHKIVFLSRKKDVWGCGYDLTYEDLSKTLINGLSNCGLSPAWSDRHKVDKLGNHGGQKKSIFSSVGSYRVFKYNCYF